jgi:MSHA pilin protein MshD
MSRSRHAGMSLIEVVVFIIVLGIGFAGILALYSQLTVAGVDPLVRKQALAIASSLLEEIELQAFTNCDPNDPLVYTANLPTDCTTQEVIGVEGAETRYGNTGPLFLRFDNVSDYNGFGMVAGAIRTIDDPTPIPGLVNYSVLANVQNIAAGELGALVPITTEALRITVTATHQPTGIAVSLQGYRLRYAPNSP